jgi:hypothetical protein
MSRRESVRTLRPLTDQQAKWLTSRGAAAAEARPPRVVWWATYFGLDPDAWTDPYALVTESPVWQAFVTRIQAALLAAREDREVWAQLLQSGELPPDAYKAGIGEQWDRDKISKRVAPKRSVYREDPLVLPEYFGWWQAENAFRRGYIEQLEAHAKDHLREIAKSQITRAGGKVTARAMYDVAGAYPGDPALAHFFQEYSKELGAGTAAQFKNLSAMLDVAWAYREKAYLQFSPFHYPKGAGGRGGGGGFLGVRKTRKARGTR